MPHDKQCEKFDETTKASRCHSYVTMNLPFLTLQKHAMTSSFDNTIRLITYHKQATSARTLFLRLNGSVCVPHSLPQLSQYLEKLQDLPVVTHPAALVAQTEKQFNLAADSLQIEHEFRAQVDTPDGTVTVYLARFTMIDPPRAEVESQEGKFIALTEARNLPSVELQLLRQAYSFIMEG